MRKSSINLCSPEGIVAQARARIAALRERLNAVDELCSGTLLEHRTRCGRAGCACAKDADARHGPYYDWGHMREGKLVHRRVSAEQAARLRLAIANYRKVKTILVEWEKETELLINTELPRQP